MLGAAFRRRWRWRWRHAAVAVCGAAAPCGLFESNALAAAAHRLVRRAADLARAATRLVLARREKVCARREAAAAAAHTVRIVTTLLLLLLFRYAARLCGAYRVLWQRGGVDAFSAAALKAVAAIVRAAADLRWGGRWGGRWCRVGFVAAAAEDGRADGGCLLGIWEASEAAAELSHRAAVRMSGGVARELTNLNP